MAFLYGRAGRLIAKNGGFWPGQCRKECVVKGGRVAELPTVYDMMGA
jgi:hypothetical protein